MDGKKAKVYLIGAGPGRIDLITVRAINILKQADCIIYDKLANPALLNNVPADAELIYVPKRIGTGSFTQDAINKLLLEKAKQHKIIARLKGGDPCVFGRGDEEAEILAQAGIDFEIVPGITSGLAAAEYSGIMLTSRKYSSQVIFVTGREAPDKPESNINWKLLADFPGTIVFYMAVENLESIVANLMKNGLSENTPVAIVNNATTPIQRFAKAPLGKIVQKCMGEKIEPPSIVIIGPAAERNEKLDWFMRQPLFGKNIVITRDKQGNTELAEKIANETANAVEFATMEIKPLTQGNEFLKALAKIHEYNWVIFTSVNGVRIFFEVVANLGKDARVLGSAKIAAVGDRTAEKLSEFGIKADFVPDVFTTKELGTGLLNLANLKDKKVLLLRSELANKELVDILGQAGATVDDVTSYTAVAVKGDSNELIEKIKQNKIDWITFANPFSAKSFFEQILADFVKSSKVKVASIGPVTTNQLKELNIKADVTASEHTFDGLIDAIKMYMAGLA